MYQSISTYGQTNIYTQHCGVKTGYPSSGKEKDSETGLSYFGARYYEPEMLNIWLSVDPMADKYPNLSPYNYCAWNPIKLVDPDGCEVVLCGNKDLWTRAIKQMQSASKSLKFSVDEATGKVSCIGKPKTRQEKMMQSIVNSSVVTVNLTVQDHNEHREGGKIFGGSFDGNKFSNEKRNHVNTYQTINVNTSAKYDKLCNAPGRMIWHELIESYKGGLNTLSSGIEATASFQGTTNTQYTAAHSFANDYFPADIHYTREGTLRIPDYSKGAIPPTYIEIEQRTNYYYGK